MGAEAFTSGKHCMQTDMESERAVISPLWSWLYFSWQCGSKWSLAPAHLFCRLWLSPLNDFGGPLSELQ